VAFSRWVDADDAPELADCLDEAAAALRTLT